MRGLGQRPVDDNLTYMRLSTCMRPVITSSQPGNTVARNWPGGRQGTPDTWQHGHRVPAIWRLFVKTRSWSASGSFCGPQGGQKTSHATGSTDKVWERWARSEETGAPCQESVKSSRMASNSGSLPGALSTHCGGTRSLSRADFMFQRQSVSIQQRELLKLDVMLKWYAAKTSQRRKWTPMFTNSK